MILGHPIGEIAFLAFGSPGRHFGRHSGWAFWYRRWCHHRAGPLRRVSRPWRPEDVRIQACIGTSLAIIVPTTIRSYIAHKKKAP